MRPPRPGHPSLDFGSARIFPHLRLCLATAVCLVVVLFNAIPCTFNSDFFFLPPLLSTQAISQPKTRRTTAAKKDWLSFLHKAGGMRQWRFPSTYAFQNKIKKMHTERSSAGEKSPTDQSFFSTPPFWCLRQAGRPLIWRLKSYVLNVL